MSWFAAQAGAQAGQEDGRHAVPRRAPWPMATRAGAVSRAIHPGFLSHGASRATSGHYSIPAGGQPTPARRAGEVTLAAMHPPPSPPEAQTVV